MSFRGVNSLRCPISKKRALEYTSFVRNFAWFNTALFLTVISFFSRSLPASLKTLVDGAARSQKTLSLKRTFARNFDWFLLHYLNNFLVCQELCLVPACIRLNIRLVLQVSSLISSLCWMFSTAFSTMKSTWICFVR